MPLFLPLHLFLQKKQHGMSPDEISDTYFDFFFFLGAYKSPFTVLRVMSLNLTSMLY